MRPSGATIAAIDEARPDGPHAAGQEEPGEGDEDDRDEADDEEHRRDARPVDLAPVGAEGVADIAASGRDRRQPEEDEADRDDRAAGLPQRPSRSLALGDTGPGDHAAERGEVLGMALLEVGDAEGGDERLDDGRPEGVRRQHRRDRRRQAVRAVEGVPVLAEQEGLDAELDPDGERGDRDPGIGADAGRPDPPVGQDRRAAGEEAVRGVADERQDDRHVEAVGEDGEDAAVAEEEGLDDQGDADGDDRRPRPEDDGDERPADSVSGRPAGHRDVEHHDREAHRREDGEEGDRPVRQHVLDAAGRDDPGRDGHDAHADGDDRAQVSVRDVHPVPQRDTATAAALPVRIFVGRRRSG